MAGLKVLLFVSAVVTVSGVVEQEAGNFPLRDCQAGQLDVLVLQTANRDPFITSRSLLAYLNDVWMYGEERNSRVLVSVVKDTSGAFDNQCHIEMRRFDEEVIDVCSSFPVLTSAILNSSSLLVEIEQKMKISASIFSDLGVVRTNSTHVAVLMFDAQVFPDLTLDEVRRIPDLLQNENFDIKFLVLVYDFFRGDVETIFLRDTLVIGLYLEKHHLSLALCNQCPSGWFTRDRDEAGDDLSCYKLLVTPYNMDWSQSAEWCSLFDDGFLAAVESKEELEFLQVQIFLHLLNNRPHIHNTTDSVDESIVVYIGLNRDSTTVAKRFQWTLNDPPRVHPLVLSHWLPGNPVGGFNQGCAVWFYSGIFSFNIPAGFALGNVSAGKLLFTEYLSENVEGWSSVGCGENISRISLCEKTLPRYLQEYDITETYSANEDSFNIAANRSGFQVYQGSIVSVVAKVYGANFLIVLKDENDKDFPMFDCEDDDIAAMYISFLLVSDFIEQCAYGRDETLRSVNPCRTCQCIPEEAVCDNIKDCQDGSDEEDCEVCRGRMCGDGTCLPLHLFNDGEIDCSPGQTPGYTMFNDESSFLHEYNLKKEMCAFTCNRGQCIYPSQLNDSKLDCFGPEGALDETVGRLERSSSCSDRLGISIWAPRCVFLKDRYGSILGCRDMSHLQNCRDFPCKEGYVKCPSRYCIPLHYVLDGKVDCPAGEDELLTSNIICTGNFACFGSQRCLHPDQVCDGVAQCPFLDDEIDCVESCPQGLRCIAGTVTVESNHALIHLDVINFMNAYTRYLDLSGVDLSSTQIVFNKTVELLFVRFSGCKIRDLYYKLPIAYCCMSYVYMLDLSYNLISSINGGKLSYDLGPNLRVLNLSFNLQLEEFIHLRLTSLDNLDLSYTGLSYLDERSFTGFQKLKYLNLSHTRLSTFHRLIFPYLFTLQSLDLRGSPIVNFYENTYNRLVIKSSLYTDNFAMCCPPIKGTSIPDDTCHAPEDAISSCFDLIKVYVQRLLLWLMAGIALLGNLIVILYQSICEKHAQKMAYGLFVLNLRISDLIMGLHLLMIAVADVYYRGVYVLYDKHWKESVACKVAGFLVALSSETSTFFMFLITVDIFLALTFPNSEKQFSRKTKNISVSACWGAGILISVLITFGNESPFSATAMCNSFSLINHRITSWRYSLGIFIFLNFIIYFIILLGQIRILRFVSEDRISVGDADNSLVREQDITAVKQLSLVVLSNCLCWFPVAIMGFLSLSGHEISNDVYAWTVVVVIPVNSAINPVLYIVSVLNDKWERFKYGDSRPH